MRRKRLTFIAALSLLALALLHPNAAATAALVFVILVLTVMWPAREGARRSEGDGRSSDQTWPDRGMKAVLEALQEAALIIDRDLLIRYRNPVSAVAFGNMALADPLSLRFRSPELLASIETAIANAVATTATLEERRPIERHWLVEVLPVPAPQGMQPIFFLVLFHDRTAERRVERMRSDFVANASHELRTPLASLSGFIETLQGPARDDPQARDRFLAIMREQATRMSRLIDDLLSLSRIEMRRHVAPQSHADLVAVLAKVRSQLKPLAEGLGVELGFDSCEDHVLVVGDEDELIQVFANLIENACKYGSEGGRVEITLQRAIERGQAVVDASVRDFGPGIPAEHVPRLTERFYRVDVGNSRAKRGTGLGLSIVRNILLRHRARLIVDSVVGRGSTFTARFPALAENDTESARLLETS
ncbi:ATP-binding protein [Aurantimonas sp. 22II-16-19i]|uniref:ATP-binding protein n=1 Tax=Aurantimonas sp. 22II-16-19i TaxID=1317114 RepID=UPI0009F802A9|nr:ATP-binding protein [Aurantimonas sp. 22II-16-19i]ORE97620.1 phosphate regulon sensor protein PHOR [Aurantimonas sp. 22II-16-19i]